MGSSLPLHGPQGSGIASEYLLDVPFEAYTDSPEAESDANKSNIRVEAIPRRAQVGPHLTSAWRRIRTSFIRSFASGRTDEDEDEDTLPLLSEDPQQRKQWKKTRRSRWSRCFIRALIGFFVML